jgi:hypothetical protein
MESLGTGPLGDLVLHPKQWVEGLVNTGILNLLEIPHFRRGKDVNNYIKKLLEVLHGGFLWLDEPVSIDVETNFVHHRTCHQMVRSLHSIWMTKPRKRHS